jgi:hypothetical protein
MDMAYNDAGGSDHHYGCKVHLNVIIAQSVTLKNDSI